MIENFAVAHLGYLEPKIMFQLDGPTPHWRHFVRDCIDDSFPSRWIGWMAGGPISWSPRLPNITQ